MPTPSNTSSETRPTAEWGAIANPCSDRSESGQHPRSGISHCRSNSLGWCICEWARSPRSRSRNQTRGFQLWNLPLSSFCSIRPSVAAVQTAPVRTSLRPAPQTERRHQHPDNRTLMKPRVARVQVPSASVSVRGTEIPDTSLGQPGSTVRRKPAPRRYESPEEAVSAKRWRGVRNSIRFRQASPGSNC